MSTQRSAILAGGCFWCLEAPFIELNGVSEVIPGYTGGTVPNPTYEQVCTGTTGHFEVVRVTYDPSLIGFSQLLDVFWRQIDPTDEGGQFADRGEQYRTAIFFSDESERKAAQQSLERAMQSGLYDNPIRTLILPLQTFYPAEDYHREYYRTHPQRYQLYRKGSGRQDYIEQMEQERQVENDEKG